MNLFRVAAAVFAVALVQASDATAQGPLRNFLFGAPSGGCPNGQCPNGQCPTAGRAAAVPVAVASSTTTTTEVVTYAAVMERVKAGRVVLVSFRAPTRAYAQCDDCPETIAPGLYTCYLEAGVPTMQFHPPARRVAAAGPHWTFPGSTRAELIRHLSTHPNHATRHTRAELEVMTFEQLLSAHDADHTGR